jgi:hypothetical protein
MSWIRPAFRSLHIGSDLAAVNGATVTAYTMAVERNEFSKDPMMSKITTYCCV